MTLLPDSATPPAVDWSEAERFLTLLDDAAETFTFQTYMDKKNARGSHQTLHDSMAALAGKLTDLNNAGAAVCVTVNETDGKGRKDMNITRVRAVFADFDGTPLPLKWPLEPHVITESSPDRWHAYWFVDGLPLAEFTSTMRLIAARFGSDANVCDLPRVMRLPGFLHHKGVPFRSRIIHESGGQAYHANTIRDTFAPTPAILSTNSLPTNEPVERITDAQLSDLRSALFSLSADDRDAWVANGHRLKTLGDVGRTLWTEWSQTSERWKSGDEKQWETFKSARTDYRAIFADAQRHGWPNPARGNNVLQTLAPAEVAATGSWPEPTPLPNALPPVAPFDARLLPGALRVWVMDIAERMQCPPDFPAVGAVTALSSLVGARAVMAPKERDDWRVVPNLWGLIVGRPGVMKSPALGQVMKPLERMEAAERERWQQEHSEWERDRALSELELKENLKRASRMVGKDKDKARELLAPVETPPAPSMRRYVVNDSSQEKLADLLTVNRWGLLVYRDELDGLIRSMDKQGQEGARGFFLTAYDGNQGYAVDRIGRGESYVPRVCLAMLGGTQPSKAQRYVRDAVAGGIGDDGLLQRFGLTVWPDVSREWRKVDRWPDTQARQTAWAVFERLNGLQTMDDKAREWRFSPGAQDVYWDWAAPFERQLRGDELHPALVSHLAKYRKLVPALALLFALVDAPNDELRVGKAELVRALQWADYLRTHAERLYAAAVVPETAAAESLLSKLRAGKLKGNDGLPVAMFTPRQVATKHWAALSTPADVRKAADLLDDYGWLRAETVRPGVQGGRPSDRYLVHPSLRTGCDISRRAA